jgi:ABC-type lipoprotein export system ATPase subunit
MIAKWFAKPLQPDFNAPVIQIADLWRTYRTGARQEIHALRGVTLSIEKPCVVAVKGRSGSGKTTLLNCVGGLDKPTRGRVSVFGQDLAKLKESQLTKFRRGQVSFIFQSFGLNPLFSAYENVDILLRIAGASNKICRQRTEELLNLVGLTRWRNHRPDELSGGQQQRIAIARSLANHPKLLLADEPTGDLDTATTRDILTLFRRIVAEENVTILLTSHDPLVDEYVDRVVRLQDGAVVAEAQ